MQNQNQTQASNKERFFSVELKSKSDLKNITITNGAPENVVIEGTIGELLRVGFTEGVVLEVTGEKGVLTVDMLEVEIKRALQENPNHDAATTDFVGGE